MDSYGQKIKNLFKPFFTSTKQENISDKIIEQNNKLLELKKCQAKDIMVVRTNMKVLEENATYDEIVAFYEQHKCSHIPIYQKSLDHIIGILNIKDLLLVKDKEHFSLTTILYEPFFVHEFKKLEELIKIIKKPYVPMIIVIDEYGGTSGLITKENIINELVYYLSDNHYSKDFLELNSKEYLLNGNVKIKYVNDKLQLNLSSEFDTIAGFILSLLGYFPKEKEKIIYDTESIIFYVDEIKNNKIEKIRIMRFNKTSL